MTVPIVTTSGPITSENLESIKLLGQSFLEVLDGMGAATVRFFGEERQEYVDGEFTKIPENLRPALYVPAWAFFNAAYIVGRPAADGAEAAGTGAAMVYNAARNGNFSSEEFWMGVSAALAGTGAVVGTFAVAASPKLPISFTNLPLGTTTEVVATGTRGAPALAFSTSTVSVPAIAVSADGSAAVAGILTGPTVMYATGNTNGISPSHSSSGMNEILNEASDGYAAKLHNDWRATRIIIEGEAADGLPMREPRWKEVKADDPSFANTPEQFRRIRTTEDGKSIYEVDIANLDFERLPKKFQYENAEAAKGAIEILQEWLAGQDGTRTVIVDLESASEIVHEQWLQRNGSWAPPEQKLVYKLLSEVEKEKDRAIVRGAVEFINERSFQSGNLTIFMLFQ